jgi:quinoprotein glucose dehydrogenase
MNTLIDRRKILISTSALGLFAFTDAAQMVSAAAPLAVPSDTNWPNFANDLAATRYAGLDQINAANFNTLEVAWRFKTDNFGPRKDPYLNCTPIVVNGRLYATVGLDRDLVCLDPRNGETLWTYRHDEKGRLGIRGGSGWGASYWTDGTAERILYVTRSYQLISIDTKTGLPDPAFGDGNEVDLRLDFDHEVDPKLPILGLHAAPLIVRNTAVIGVASSDTGPGYLRGFDVRTGKRKWIFHTVPKKGEFGYDTWIKPGQAETATNTGVWAPMSADQELGLVYAGVELPQSDTLGVTRWGNALFTESLLALDSETGKLRWYYQTEHHGLWDRDVCAAAVLFDLPYSGKTVKALALPTKESFLFVLDRTTGKPVWPVVEKPAPKGDVPGEWYPPTQPWPAKPPAFDRQGFSADDVIDFTPELKERALQMASHYRLGPLYTPPTMAKLQNPNGPWGTLATPENQGGANWPGGSYDPETGIFYLYSKSTLQIFGYVQQPDGSITIFTETARATNDNMGASFGGQANPNPRPGIGGPVAAGLKDGLNDPIVPGLLTVNGLSILKPPYGRITAIDLKSGTKLWQVAHGETPDFVKHNPLLKGVSLPRTGQSGILGVLTTKSLVICGDSGAFTDEQGRKAARFRAYDKATGKEVGAVFMDQPQTGCPMTYMAGGRQHIVVASGGYNGSEFICFRLPA